MSNPHPAETFADPFPVYCTTKSYQTDIIMGIRLQYDRENDTDFVASFAKCRNPTPTQAYHKLTVICGFTKTTTQRAGLLKKIVCGSCLLRDLY